MEPAQLPDPGATIRFSAELLLAKGTEKLGSSSFLILPKAASAKLPSQGATVVEGTIHGFPFRAILEPDGQGSHCFRIKNALREAAGVEEGEKVSVEITRTGEEAEVRVPAEFRQALAVAPLAQSRWADITPGTRRDWILWITSGKLPETRLIRIEKACSMLASGKRRVCCFGGLRWLTKDAKTVDTWLPLPGSNARSSPRAVK